jgi:hypothetical protein
VNPAWPTATGPENYRRTKDGNPADSAVDGVTVGALLGLFSRDNPVLPGQTVSFKVYTTSADHLSFFGPMPHPTPVIPEPATTLLAGLGGPLLLIRRRKA